MWPFEPATPWFLTTTAKVTYGAAAVIAGAVAYKSHQREKLIDDAQAVIAQMEKFAADVNPKKIKKDKAFHDFLVASEELTTARRTGKRRIKAVRSELRKEIPLIQKPTLELLEKVAIPIPKTAKAKA